MHVVKIFALKIYTAATDVKHGSALAFSYSTLHHKSCLMHFKNENNDEEFAANTLVNYDANANLKNFHKILC
jgi:hypothetical protein